MPDGDALGPEADDLLREQLLDAAARVFAAKGYAGTKIMDIVKEAGLSSGAVYGRFSSKDELLNEAVLRKIERNVVVGRYSGMTVTEILIEASRADGELDDSEAVQLEAFLAARRSPDVAKAITKGRRRWRRTVIEDMVKQAIAEGDADPNADFESIVYFIESLQLGLMAQRGAGQTHPDPQAWLRFVEGVIRTAATTPKQA